MKSSESKSKQHPNQTHSNQPFFSAKSNTRFFEKGESSATPFFAASNIAVQAKLTVGAVGDKYEQEADQVAANVVAQLNDSSPQNIGDQQSVQRMAEEDEDIQMSPATERMQRMAMEDEELQMKPVEESVQRMGEDEEELQMKPTVQRVGIGGGAVPEDFERQLSAARGGGQSLAPELQAQMGQTMGADFSGVRVHTDTNSDQLNQSIQAKAFTTGQDVFFRQGAYEPGSRTGQELIAHELTHVMQQNRADSTIQRARGGGKKKGKFIGVPSAIHIHIGIASPHLKLGGKGHRYNFPGRGGGYDEGRMQEALDALESGDWEGRPGYTACRDWLRSELGLDD